MTECLGLPVTLKGENAADRAQAVDPRPAVWKKVTKKHCFFGKELPRERKKVHLQIVRRPLPRVS